MHSAPIQWRQTIRRSRTAQFACFIVVIVLLLIGFTPGVLRAQQVTETRKILPAGVETNDQFGFSVGISGSTAIVGARFDADLGSEAGAAYHIDASSGTVIRKYLPIDGDQVDRTGASRDIFGESVAIAGNLAVIGAPKDSTAGRFAGAAYVYDTTNGRLITRLLPFAPIINDPTAGFFGFSVAASTNFIVVGATADVERNSGAGAAYLYTAGTNPQLIGKIYASDPGFADNFGRRVAVSNAQAAIAAPFDDDNGSDSGSVYVFNAATGQQQFKLTPNDGAASDFFGLGLAINDTTVAVGASFADALGVDSGAVYLFDAASGQQLAKLTPNDGAAGDRFGESVALSGSTLVVGAPGDDGVGSAYVFDPASGVQQAKLRASDGQAGDAFGKAVAIDGTTVMIGAPGDDDNGSLSGSIYIFNLAGSPGSPTPTATAPATTATPSPTVTPTSAPPTPTPRGRPGRGRP